MRPGDTSADSAARFERARRRREKRETPRAYRRRRPRIPDEVLGAPIAKLLRAPTIPPPPRRIACDFAEPTLRLIHEVLLDAMHANVDFGDRHALLMIAEQMVAQALGDPPCDDPPLTDREVR